MTQGWSCLCVTRSSPWTYQWRRSTRRFGVHNPTWVTGPAYHISLLLHSNIYEWVRLALSTIWTPHSSQCSQVWIQISTLMAASLWEKVSLLHTLELSLNLTIIARQRKQWLSFENALYYVGLFACDKCLMHQQTWEVVLDSKERGWSLLPSVVEYVFMKFCAWNRA